MSIGTLESSNMISYLPASAVNLVEYYTTVESDEIIMFVDNEDGNVQRNLNSLFVENVGDTTLFVQPIPSKYLLCIPAHESRAYDKTRTTGIKIIGEAGAILRWSGCFY